MEELELIKVEPKKIKLLDARLYSRAYISHSNSLDHQAQERDKLETELLQKQRDEEKRLEQELADSMSRGIPDMRPIPILSKLEQQAKADAEGASYGK